MGVATTPLTPLRPWAPPRRVRRRRALPATGFYLGGARRRASQAAPHTRPAGDRAGDHMPRFINARGRPLARSRAARAPARCPAGASSPPPGGRAGRVAVQTSLHCLQQQAIGVIPLPPGFAAASACHAIGLFGRAWSPCRARAATRSAGRGINSRGRIGVRAAKPPMPHCDHHALQPAGVRAEQPTDRSNSRRAWARMLGHHCSIRLPRRACRRSATADYPPAGDRHGRRRRARRPRLRPIG